MFASQSLHSVRSRLGELLLNVRQCVQQLAAGRDQKSAPETYLLHYRVRTHSEPEALAESVFTDAHLS